MYTVGEFNIKPDTPTYRMSDLEASILRKYSNFGVEVIWSSLFKAAGTLNHTCNTAYVSIRRDKITDPKQIQLIRQKLLELANTHGLLVQDTIL